MMTKDFYDEKSEKALLGCIINDNKCLSDIQTQLTPEMFFFKKHQIIYKHCLSLYKSGVQVDILSLTRELTNNGLIGAAGGEYYVTDLNTECSSAANFKYYSNIILEHSQSRAIKENLLVSLDKLGKEDNAEIIKAAEDQFFKISSVTAASKIWTASDLCSAFLEKVNYAKNTWGEEKGINVGFPTLDRMTGGFQEEDFVIIGARPSIGKTALAISMMKNLLERDVPCGFISAEMNQNQIMTRLFTMKTRIPGFKFRNGILSPEEIQKITDATAYYGDKKFYIDDTPNITLNALISSARHMKLHYGIKILFIDYLGLIRLDGNSPLWEKVGEISRSLKALARELKIPILALSQLGREAEGSSPNIANLRGSGSVEQDADLVILLNGERDLTCYRNINPFLERDLTLAKHRNGPCGKVYLDFEKELTLFTEAPDQEARDKKEREKQREQKTNY